ncbi:MAG TPA: hypothetical protein DCR64_06105, partial [Vibrio sp.]|nr:hypothetical protein [Vibrio sp.]
GVFFFYMAEEQGFELLYKVKVTVRQPCVCIPCLLSAIVKALVLQVTGLSVSLPIRIIPFYSKYATGCIL